MQKQKNKRKKQEIIIFQHLVIYKPRKDGEKMCVFLYLVTRSRINDISIKTFSNLNIGVDLINNYLEVTSDQLVYDLHRQCACDFFKQDNNANNSSDIKKLIQEICKKDNELKLIKTEDEPDEFSIVKYKNKEITLHGFLNIYPDMVEENTAYKIKI